MHRMNEISCHRLTVGKQTLCKLSFTYILVKSRVNLTVRTKPKFGKFVVLFALGICEIFYISYVAHIFCYITIKSLTCLRLVAKNTSETSKFLNVDKCFKERKH